MHLHNLEEEEMRSDQLTINRTQPTIVDNMSPACVA